MWHQNDAGGVKSALSRQRRDKKQHLSRPRLFGGGFLVGDRYFLTVKCPSCDIVDENVYYAPTCGFVSHVCSGCGAHIDLAEYTGISYEDASNAVKEMQ